MPVKRPLTLKSSISADPEADISLDLNPHVLQINFGPNLQSASSDQSRSNWVLLRGLD